MYSCKIVKIFSDGVKFYDEEIKMTNWYFKRLHGE